MTREISFVQLKKLGRDTPQDKYAYTEKNLVHLQVNNDMGFDGGKWCLIQFSNQNYGNYLLQNRFLYLLPHVKAGAINKTSMHSVWRYTEVLPSPSAMHDFIVN